MSNLAWGFACPGCGETDDHHIQAYEWTADGFDLASLRLSCNHCETVWSEDLSDFETVPE